MRKEIIPITVLIVLILSVTIVPGFTGSMEHKRESFISLKNSIQQELMPNHQYRCCLEKPCTYCIEKSPGHGEGAVCNCLEDIVNGKHPCGECIGEILEGHGNPYLKEYFAEAIAEEVGMQHFATIQEIIDEKYGEEEGCESEEDTSGCQI